MPRHVARDRLGHVQVAEAIGQVAEVVGDVAERVGDVPLVPALLLAAGEQDGQEDAEAEADAEADEDRLAGIAGDHPLGLAIAMRGRLARRLIAVADALADLRRPFLDLLARALELLARPLHRSAILSALLGLALLLVRHESFSLSDSVESREQIRARQALNAARWSASRARVVPRASDPRAFDFAGRAIQYPAGRDEFSRGRPFRSLAEGWSA